MSRGRGRGGFRRGRTSARRDSESEEGSPLRNGQLSGSRTRNRNSDSALIKKASEEDSEPEFIALNGASLKGKKGKLTLKNARGKPAGARYVGFLFLRFQLSLGLEAWFFWVSSRYPLFIADMMGNFLNSLCLWTRNKKSERK